MSLELGARFEVKFSRIHDCEIDLDYCETKDEAFENAIKEFEEDDCPYVLTEDSIELVEIACWSSNRNIVGLEHDVDWKGMFENNFSHIYDLNQLKDDDDRVVALHLHTNGGYSNMRDACSVARQQSYVMYGDESELINRFVEAEDVKASVIMHLDHESILDYFWPDRINMPDGKILIMMD